MTTDPPWPEVRARMERFHGGSCKGRCDISLALTRIDSLERALWKAIQTNKSVPHRTMAEIQDDEKARRLLGGGR
jgi:hypothetical protein